MDKCSLRSPGSSGWRYSAPPASRSSAFTRASRSSKRAEADTRAARLHGGDGVMAPWQTPERQHEVDAMIDRALKEPPRPPYGHPSAGVARERIREAYRDAANVRVLPTRRKAVE